MHRLEIKKSAQKDLRKLTPSFRQKIIEKIRDLAHEPRPNGAIRLANRDEWRIRYTDYRILYEIDDKSRLVTVVRIKHRRSIYKSLTVF